MTSSRLIIAVIACGMVAALLVSFMPLWFINPDTAHHVSVAKNVLAGDGFSTSVLYYDEQYSTGQLPAPQTLWPPGYPALIAAVAVFGFSPVKAAFFLSIFAHFLIAVLLVVVTRMMALRKPLDFVCAAIWLGLVPAALLPLSAFTESVFTALTLLSTILLVRASTTSDDKRLMWLIAAGTAAGSAFAVRYMGICFIAALSIVMAVRYLKSPSWQIFREGVALLAVPVGLVGLIFLRNAQLTGDPSGGPAVSQGTTLIQVLESLYWSALMALGVSGQGLVRAVSIVVLALIFAVALINVSQRMLIKAGSTSDPSRRTFSTVAVLYSLLTAGVLVYVAYGRTHELIQWRYLIPLIPFLLLCIGIALSDAFVHARQRRPMLILATMVIVVLMLAQWRVLTEWDKLYVNVRQGRQLEAVMHERVDGRTFLSVLNTRPNAPILTQDGQALAAFVDQPVLGMASPFYTKTVWTEAVVRDLVGRYDVGWVAFFPQMFHPGSMNDSNRPFFEQIAANDVPQWLNLVHSSEQIQLFEVRAQD